MSSSFRSLCLSALALSTVAIAVVGSLFLAPTSASAGLFDDWLTTGSRVPYCNGSADCSIDRGSAIVKDNINDIEKNRAFSVYIQDIMAYLLYFIGIVAVLYVIYAGFHILTSAGKDDAIKKSKNTILHVAIGIVIIFLAYPVVRFVINLVNTRTGMEWVNRTYAADGGYMHFDDYKTEIQYLQPTIDREYQVDQKLSAKTIAQLKRLIEGSMQTFPDDTDPIYNNNLANQVLTSIALVEKNPSSSTAIEDMARSLVDYLGKIKISRVKGKITATPSSGNAPLVTTLQADGVIDPSGVVVPKENFVWYLKTADGRKSVIGTGPRINYTFKEERTYSVFLSVLSSSRNRAGKIPVLPLDTSATVDVKPRIGTLSVLVDNTAVTNLEVLKITPSVGSAGVLFDATATSVEGGTTFVNTSWDFGNGQKLSRQGGPRVERQTYATEGTYHVKLTIVLNTGGTLEKEFDLEVRDPIAQIKVDREVIYVNEDLRFYAQTPSNSTNNKFEWVVTHLDQNQEVYRSNLQSISYTFKKRGKYKVQLKTTTVLAREDYDSKTITVEGREPVAAFDSAQKSTELPNTLVLDASKSYDPDTLDNSRLTYQWYVDGRPTTLENPSRMGALGEYTFGTLGTHTVALEVKNADGKLTAVKKDINITSTFWVRLTTTPRIAVMGRPIAFIGQSADATVYEWDYGDGVSEVTNGGRASHVYKKSGAFSVKLNVKSSDGKEVNSITRQVYVVATNSPAALITMRKENEEIFAKSGECNGKSAFVIDRTKSITLDASESINVDGSNTNLEYVWSYLGKNATSQTFSYKFDELGCFPVNLTVRSSQGNTTSTDSVMVKVENVAPYVSSIGIKADTTKDPVVADITAGNARDDDGAIVSYLWYYTTDNDPDPQDFRVTRVPKTSFVIPKVTGTYYFNVVVEDTNGAKYNPSEATGEQYSLSIATDNVNTPIIKLKTSSSSVNVGDAVDFEVESRNVLGQDLAGKAEYQWDFDGDGFYDKKTESPRISYQFTTPGNITAKVKVTYKGISNTRTQTIAVKNVIKPNFDILTVGDTLILKNTSLGAYSQVQWAVGSDTGNDRDAFVHQYPNGAFPDSAKLTVSDGLVSKDIIQDITIDRVSMLRAEHAGTGITLFTLPRSEGGTVTLNAPTDTLLLYLGASKGGVKYVIDTDTKADSDLNGTPDDDQDNKNTPSFVSGAPFVLRNLNDGRTERTIRVTLYDAKDQVVESKDLTVSFAFAKTQTSDIHVENVTASGTISDRDRINLEMLKNLIAQVNETHRLKMMEMLSGMQTYWSDSQEKTRRIIDFQGYIENATGIDDKIKDQFYNVLDGFLFQDQEAVSDVSLAVNVIKGLLPDTLADKNAILEKLDAIRSHAGNLDENKKLGKEILDIIAKDTTIPNDDKLIIKAQLQTIIYGGSENTPKDTPTTDSSNTSSSSGFMAIALMVLGGFVKVFGVLIVLLILATIGLFIYYKVSSKDDHLGFQDFLIEFFSNGFGQKDEASPKKNGDLLGSLDSAPVAQAPAVVAQNPATEATPAAPNTLPDWLKNASLGDANGSTPTEPTTSTAEATNTPDATESTNGLPDWLKGVQDTTPDTTNTITNGEGIATPESTETLAPTETGDVPDWLKGTETTETTDTTLEASTPAETDDIPDWMKPQTQEENTTQTTAEAPQAASEATVVTPTTSSDDVPDWLKDNDTFAPKVATDTPAETPAQDTPVEPSTADNLPDWMRGMDAEAVTSEVATELEKPSEAPATTTSTSDLPDWLKEAANLPTETTPTPATVTEEEAVVPETTQPSGAEAMPTTDDIPDWLKETETPVADEAITPAEAPKAKKKPAAKPKAEPAVEEASEAEAKPARKPRAPKKKDE